MAERRNPFTDTKAAQEQRIASGVGNFITHVRKSEVGQNFPEFARKLGMNELEYSNWESGRNGRISPDQIEDWSNKLGWDNDTTINLYFSSNHQLPEDRDTESTRQWELAVYRSKYEGTEHPFNGAMRELLDNQPIWINVLNSISKRLRK